MDTTQDRWERAIKAARKAIPGVKVKIRQNVQECCRGCIGWEKLGFKSEEELQETPYAFTYGGQGRAYTWYGGEMVDRKAITSTNRYYRPKLEDMLEETVYFNHGNGGAEPIAEAMKAEGFNVEWDGSDEQCVIVHLPKEDYLARKAAREEERELEYAQRSLEFTGSVFA